MVTLTGGGTNEYLRYGDTYHELPDGSLDVIRTGVKEHINYAAGSWVGVEGDERTWKKRLAWR
ncbi:hypothetical protein [Mycolicibacterium sediminis]|uniref:Uncharacterized protein n=1 Tax=Mycolicibacterium sediminis TaxID=1286180 RepID=A0A7I7QPN4_9MYCO|nr:hypothetical protein [Mycolicibacterium sediminis]BBY28182.1 hypothetical protein MSEDJ_22780 [Mycolicibacterium sediminis]